MTSTNAYFYGHQQLSRAVTYLATQDGPAAKRLEDVALDNLGHINPEVDLPEELRDEFIKIKQRLDKVWGTSEEEGTLVRAVRTMDDQEVRSTIDAVVDLYVGICKETGY